MSANEALRRLLDERGAKWTSERVGGGVLFTFTKDGRTYSVFVRDGAGLEIWSQYLTPEQAIAATLGPETCRIDYHFGEWYCTGCGEMVGTCDEASELRIDGNAIELWHFCPNCGRRVVREVVE